ncbi:MAG: hypothetical protein WC475_02270 [Candidatus Paceibacterota bacterium]
MKFYKFFFSSGLLAAVIVFFGLYFLFSAGSVSASTNISATSTEHWGWNDVVGWIDFYSTSNVNVSSTKMTGYASSSVGFIAFDCATSPNGDVCATSDFKIVNDSAGNLSGYAWSESIGWISFYCGDLDPTCATYNYRVTIDSNGEFSGWAWNDVVGWISFNCNNSVIGDTCDTSDYKVKTSWSASAATGTIVSSIFDTGVSGGAAFNSIMWKCDASTSTICQPAGTAVKFQFASGNASAGVGGTGPIDGTYRYAWNDSTGWWDFGYSSGNVYVSSTQLTGYAYNTNLAEISLDCATSPGGNVCSSSNYKVSRNSTTGELSGYAWNDSIGWISFNCSDLGVCATSNYKVTVNPTSGVFTGYAWNDDVGWISFNCSDPGFCGSSNYYVSTSQTGFSELIGPGGTSLASDTYNPTGPDTPIAINRLYHNNHRYFRYKIILESDVAETVGPRVDDVIVNWSP